MSSQTLELKIIAALRKAGSKLTVFQIADQLKMKDERKAVTKACAAMHARNELVKSGAGKGTYYELPTSERGSSPAPTIDTSAARNSVLNAINAGAGMRMNEIVSATGLSATLARPLVLELLEAKEIKSFGVRAGTRYYALNGEIRAGSKEKVDPLIGYHMRQAVDGSASEDESEVTPLIGYHMRQAVDGSASEDESEVTPPPQKISGMEAVDRTIKNLKIGERITPHELASRAISAWCDDDTSHLAASDYAYALVRRQVPELYSGWDNSEGRRIVVWRPREGEVRPDPKAIVSLITGRAVK
jgi:hypothetical protein